MESSIEADRPPVEDIDRLTLEARRLRDYLLRIGSKAGLKLVTALAPFENGGDRVPSAEAVQRLYAAFQTSFEEAIATIDPYTINEVVDGNSPYRPQERSARRGAGLLMICGLFLVVLALFYTFWANRAASTLGRVEEFREFNHFGEVMQLVEFERVFEQMERDSTPLDVQPAKMYLEDIAGLQRHYFDEAQLPVDITFLNNNNQPFSYALELARKPLCPEELEDFADDPPGFLTAWLCPKPPQWWLDSRKASQAQEGGIDRQAPDGSDPPIPVSSGEIKEAVLTGQADVSGGWLRNSSNSLWELRRAVMSHAGRSPLKMASDYRESRQTILFQSEELAVRLNNVQRVWLPLIWGFLGSIVHCMWRMLSPGIAPYRPMYTAMRTAFAGLAALTLSMILVPSNAMTLGVSASHPLIYLVAFVFGYSIEAFITTLNNLNRSLSSALAPKDRSR